MSENIEVLNSVCDRQAVVWLWCKWQNALEKLENDIQCNTLMNLLTSLTNDPKSAVPLHRQHCRITLDSNQFKKEVGKYIFRIITIL